MLKPLLLRYCICSLLAVTVILDCAAQRSARRRNVATTTTSTIVDKPITKLPGQTIEDGLVEIQWDKLNTDADSKKSVINDLSRQTKNINKDNIADSYPYITEDGLRLYFTSNREGGHGRFFISTRKSIADPFGEPKVLSRNLTDGYYAGTLTADELTLCMVKSGAMYISTRTNKDSEFSVPVKLEGASDRYHFGPSISSDGKLIFVTTSDGKDKTTIYQRIGPTKVSKVKDLILADGVEAGPGQLSKDGLSYYLSIDVKTQEHLWRYTRKSVNEDFGNLSELPGQSKEIKNMLQPTLNGDGSVMLFVTAADNLWESDDIMLINNNKRQEITIPKLPDHLAVGVGSNIITPAYQVNKPELVVYSDALKGYPNSIDVPAAKNNSNLRRIPSSAGSIQLKIYPNPFISTVNLEISKLPSDGAVFMLYDESGKVICEQKINNTLTSLAFPRALAGNYTYQVVDSKGLLIASGKLLKIQ